MFVKKKIIAFAFVLFMLFAAICVSPAKTVGVGAAGTSHAQGAVTVDRLLDQVSCSWDGTELKSYPSGQPVLTVLKITVPPHEKLNRHYHSVVNVGYMVEGELRVTADSGQVKTIKAGEALVEMVDSIHYGENPGDTPAVIVVFYAGDSSKPITTEVGSES